jgi:hypothetical protein
MEIRLVASQHIDRNRWDQCVANAINENPMGYSWFLDIMCDNWMGLVMGDYHAVMPLEWKGWGWMRRSSHSPYIQFQGVYTSDPCLKIDLQTIIHHAFGRKWLRFVFCETPGFPVINAPTVQMRTSYVLDLQPQYAELEKNYAPGHQKNLRRAKKLGVLVMPSTDSQLFTLLKKQMTENRHISTIDNSTAKKMELLINVSLQKGTGDLMMALNSNNQTCAVAFFLIGQKRCIIFSASNQSGRETKATFALVDAFIAKQAGKQLILDFAGSSIKGIADFNQGFGAVATNYNRFEIDTIPHLLRKLF